MEQTLKIGQCLKRIRRPVAIENDIEYKLVTIRLKHGGVVERCRKMGKDIGTKKMYQVRSGDFILSGIDARNGAFGIVPPELDGAVVTNDFWYFDVNEDAISTDLFLALTQTTWFDHICRLGSDGTTQRIRLQKDKFFNQKITLPPVKKQVAILKRLQNFKSSGSELTIEIEKQKKRLAKYRQAILQEAIEGKLTADWRAENPDIEPAAELLKRIAAEKAELVKQKKITKGRKQIAEKSEELLFEIPPSWQWCDLDDMTQYITDGTHQTPTYVISGRMFLSAQNIKPFRFMPEEHKHVSQHDFDNYRRNRIAEKGDLLVARVGAGIGETAVVDQNIEFAFYVSLGLVKIFKDLSNSIYLSNVFNSPYGVKYSKGNISSKGGSAGNFNLGRIRSFPIPVPPLTEQQEIVRRVEAKFALCDKLEAQINASAQTAETLSAAILQELFDQNGGEA